MSVWLKRQIPKLRVHWVPGTGNSMLTDVVAHACYGVNPGAQDVMLCMWRGPFYAEFCCQQNVLLGPAVPVELDQLSQVRTKARVESRLLPPV